MDEKSSEVIIALIAGTFLILVLGSLIVIALFVNQRRKIRYKQELLDTQEAILKSISQELHDNIGAMISLAMLNLNLAKMRPENFENHLSEAKILLDNTISSLRNISASLNSEHLVTKGLLTVIKEEAARLENTGVYAIRFSCTASGTGLPAKLEIIVLRIFQECLNNIIKHSRADEIEIDISHKNGFFIVKVKDNGRGFQQQDDTGKANRGSGLLNMSSRAKQLNADFEINSAAGKGTLVILKVPVAKL